MGCAAPQLVVSGNRIGTDASGTAAIANGRFGVWLTQGTSGARVGTNGDGVSDSLERNVISGNASTGVLIDGNGTAFNVVAGNYIGTNADGTADLGNGGHGIVLQAATKDNRIGTDGSNDAFNASERNVIAGNDLWAQVAIYGVGVDRNVFAGNYVGLQASGNAGIRTVSHAVAVGGGAADTRIGTDGNGVGDAEERNVFAATDWGPLVEGLGTTRTVFAGNYVGLNANGNASIPNSGGLTIRWGASDTRVGTDGSNDAFNLNERNVISGTVGIGVVVQTNNFDGQLPAGGATTNNTVIAGNYIGLNAQGTATIANGSSGIYAPNRVTNLRIGTDGNGLYDD